MEQPRLMVQLPEELTDQIYQQFLNIANAAVMHATENIGFTGRSFLNEKELKKCETQINEIYDNIKVLKDEVIKTLTGESSFTAELLNELISEKEKQKRRLDWSADCSIVIGDSRLCLCHSIWNGRRSGRNCDWQHFAGIPGRSHRQRNGKFRSHQNRGFCVRL